MTYMGPAILMQLGEFSRLVEDTRNSIEDILMNGTIEPPRPKGRRFWGNRRGCVGGCDPWEWAS